MQDIVKRIRNKVLRSTLPSILRPHASEKLTRLGSEYGGWTIPLGRLSNESVCYSFGAGEDLTFDLELAHRCGCTVHVFDPTPRAQTHFQQLNDAARIGALPKNPTFSAYRAHYLPAVAKLRFHPIGIWNEDTTLEFYEPSDPKHVSHSIVDIQATRPGFKAEVQTLDSIMRALGHDKVDLLKADIEGAEFEVVQYLIDHRLFSSILSVEFDAVAHSGLRSVGTLRTIVTQLDAHGYSLAHVENWNYLFLNGLSNF